MSHDHQIDSQEEIVTRAGRGIHGASARNGQYSVSEYDDDTATIVLDDAAMGHEELMMEPFDRYVLLKRLAYGGMGEVLLARKEGLGGFEKLLIIKRLLGHFKDDPKVVQMFFEEARLQGLMRSPNIAEVYDMGSVNGQYFIAIEFIHGPSWKELIARLDEDEADIRPAHAVELAVQLCRGMTYAHNLRDAENTEMLIVHRDINPHNILVNFQGQCKLIDFGIAKSSINLNQTEAGVIKGKYAYMSPEQARAEPVDRRSDIFSFGICLYELLTLKNPFARDNLVLSLEAISNLHPPSVDTIRPELAFLAPIVERCIAKNPDDRFADTSEIIESLTQLYEDGFIEPPDASVSDWLRALFQDMRDDHQLLLQNLGSSATLQALIARDNALRDSSKHRAAPSPHANVHRPALKAQEPGYPTEVQRPLKDPDEDPYNTQIQSPLDDQVSEAFDSAFASEGDVNFDAPTEAIPATLIYSEDESVTGLIDTPQAAPPRLPSDESPTVVFDENPLFPDASTDAIPAAIAKVPTRAPVPQSESSTYLTRPPTASHPPKKSRLSFVLAALFMLALVPILALMLLFITNGRRVSFRSTPLENTAAAIWIEDSARELGLPAEPARTVIPGDAAKDDATKIALKVDVAKDKDPLKDDAQKDDVVKDDEKDDVVKDDAQKDDVVKDDAQKDDVVKDDAQKDDAAAKEEADKLAKAAADKEEADKLAKEQADKEQAEEAAKEEAAKLAKEQAAKDKAAKEKAESQKIAAANADAAKKDAAKADAAKKVAAKKAAAKKAAAKKAAAKKAAAKKAAAVPLLGTLRVSYVGKSGRSKRSSLKIVEGKKAGVSLATKTFQIRASAKADGNAVNVSLATTPWAIVQVGSLSKGRAPKSVLVKKGKSVKVTLKHPGKDPVQITLRY